MSQPVTLDDTVEDIVASYPTASGFLLERGVVCVRCGEPAWCSLRELIDDKGLDGDAIVAELNAFLRSAASPSG